MSKTNKKVVQSKTVLTAPNFKRLTAFVIDYVVVYLALAIVITLARNSLDLDNASVSVQAAVYTLLIVLSLAYFVLVPTLIYKDDRKGQTIGKRVMGLKIIRVNGTDVTMVTLLIRTLFMLLGEGMVMISTLYVLEIADLLGMPINFIGYLGTAYIMVTLVSCTIMIIRPNRQMFHDYIANTVVILYDQKVSR